VKLTPLTLLFVCAAPARADVAVPQAKTWRDGCAARLDAAAQRLGLEPGARASLIPLRHEDGTPNPVQYVEYASAGFLLTVGEEPESRPDTPWMFYKVMDGPRNHEPARFRRLHNRFAKANRRQLPQVFIDALDECLQMGESK
jgi:hypothetical protein